MACLDASLDSTDSYQQPKQQQVQWNKYADLKPP